MFFFEMYEHIGGVIRNQTTDSLRLKSFRNQQPTYQVTKLDEPRTYRIKK